MIVTIGTNDTLASPGEKSLPLCSYPAYSCYRGGGESSADSYVCADPTTR